MSRRVLILGSGVCGLATALRFLEREPNARVTLLEQEDRPGGLARSLTLRGQVADMGPHRIFTELDDVRTFLDEIAGPDLAEVKRRSQMWLNQRWIEYPPKPLEILRVLGPWAVGKSVGVFALEKLAGKGRDLPDSYEAVMTRAFGSELYRLIVMGYTRKVWKMPPAELHGDIARVRVSAGGLDRMVKRVFLREKQGEETALPKFHYIPGGVETLVKRMAERAAAAGAVIRTNHRVASITPPAPGQPWRVDSINESGTAESHEADLVVSTIPVTDLVDFLQPHQNDEAVRAARGNMRFIANFLVCFAVDRPRVTPNQWLYFPGRDTIFNRSYEPKNFSSTMGEKNTSMLVLEVTCHHGDKIWNTPDWKLVRRCMNDMDRIGLVGRGELLDSMVYRIPYTYPIYDLGYRERVETIWRYLEQFPGLLSVGRQGLFLHNNMDHSIHMGFRAAETATREHPKDPERHFYSEVRRFQQFRIVD